MKILFNITLLFVSLSSLEAKSQIESKPINTIDTVVVKKMNESGIVGIGAAIIVDKKVVWVKGYGYSDKENKVPFTTETIMNVASITKTFTGVCIMKAVEEGILSLDEDINNYLNFKVVNPSFPNEKITLRHLVTHTSGLVDRFPIYDSTIIYGGARPGPLGEFLKDYFSLGGKYYNKENFLNKKPGAYRAYSNIAAGLAGYIVELKTGKKLSVYGKEHIFEPLKMKNTGWSLSEIKIKKHAKLYKKEGNSISPIQFYEGITYPDGGIRTTVKDLSKFFISLLNDGKYNNTRILQEQTTKEMTRFQYNETNKPENVNLSKLNQGIFWTTKLGATRIGHNGSDPGVRTFMLSDLEKNIGVIIFFNTSLTEDEEGIYFDIYEELYKYGESLKKRK
jgi:CubicO group peptidase (beta-lactamase class C family)